MSVHIIWRRTRGERARGVDMSWQISVIWDLARGAIGGDFDRGALSGNLDLGTFGGDPGRRRDNNTADARPGADLRSQSELPLAGRAFAACTWSTTISNGGDATRPGYAPTPSCSGAVKVNGHIRSTAYRGARSSTCVGR
jgi:hypothetical protein